MKILIADDNKNMRDMIRSIIQCDSRQIDECENGTEAICMVSNKHHDLVLMDIKMYPVNGIAATEVITAAFPETKVIIVSSYSTEQYRIKAENAGAAGFVSKENLTELNKILEDYKTKEQGK